MVTADGPGPGGAGMAQWTSGRCTAAWSATDLAGNLAGNPADAPHPRDQGSCRTKRLRRGGDGVRTPTSHALLEMEGRA